MATIHNFVYLISLSSLFQYYYITPSCSWVLALEIMLNDIGIDLGLSLSRLLGVLLRDKHNGLCAIDLVDAVDDCIQTTHFLKLFGIHVEQVLLNRTVGSYSHDEDTCFLIVIALAVELQGTSLAALTMVIVELDGVTRRIS